MGFLNEVNGEWECEDECTEEKNGMVCGEVPHFTSFAVLLSGGHGGSGCNGDDNWIIGDWEDSLLIITCFCVALGCVTLLVLLNIGCHRRLVNLTKSKNNSDRLRKMRMQRRKLDSEIGIRDSVNEDDVQL